MDTSVLTTLEFVKIRDMLAEATVTSMGRELALALEPADDWNEVENRLRETREARDILLASSHVPFGGARDIRAILRRLEIGAVLEPEELLAIASTLYAARRLKQFLTEAKPSSVLLTEKAGRITALRNLEAAIESTVSEQGIVRDEASVELTRIRREIRVAQQRVKEKLDQILHSAEYQKYFQEALVTIRGDRYVIPIKQEHRYHFPGIVHDQSASGATVFIEPMAVVNLNNDIKQLVAAEKNEVERILAALSSQVARHVDAIRQNSEIVAALDFAFAKAKLGLDMQANMPLLNDKGRIFLRQARHPLIPRDEVVPIDVRLGEDFSILLITGPNTGGKTVTLKTVGLFALMTQAGLFIPAGSGSEMPVFRNVFADIGDEQSIEQSLSTFSAHMTNLVKILAKVSAHDLVLIDEIGAGTDPGEGAALAMAILEYLHSAGARTIATTHYSELKTFAYSRHGIENASVEFDIHTLRPTYRLQIGIPGSSNAFAISRRLGLPQELIDRARQFLDKDYAQFEKILAVLEQEKKEYEERRRRAEELEAEVAALRQKLAQEEAALLARRREIIDKAQEEAMSIVRQARRQAEEVIARLKEQFSVASDKERQQAIADARRQLQRQMAELHHPELDAAEKTAPPALLTPGSTVYVTTLRQKGSVLAIKDGEAVVQLGVLKVNVPVAACRIVEEMAPAGHGHKGVSVDFAKVQSVSREIDVRGMTVAEAETVLEKYLDDALLAGLSEVNVIHGKGTGALRKGVRSYLKDHPHVVETRIGELSEGGDGVTVVKLK
ncbi:endonuclease MutS2 [Thermosinus carboxydivorans]|nr:endonuclease MutS2 [Thermosinus carboxydivorans]